MPVLVLLFGLLATPLPGFGQETATPAGDNAPSSTGDPAPADVDRLIRLLEDPAERQKLIDYLRTLEQVEDQRRSEAKGDLGTLAIDTVARHLQRISDGIVELARALSDLPKVAQWILDRSQDPEARALWLEIALRVLTVVVVAGAARWLVRWLVRRPRRLLLPQPQDRLLAAIPMQMGRLLLALLAPAAVVGATYATLAVIDARETTRLVVYAVLHAYLIVAVTMAVARELLAPHSALVRLAAMSGETAEYLVGWVRRLATIGVYGFFAARVALLLGLPSDAYQVLLRAIGLAITGLLVVFILQCRHGVTARIRGAEPHPGSIRNRIADIWHLLAIVYVLAFYFVWALAIDEGFAFLLRATGFTIGLVVAAQLAILGLGRLLRHLFSFSADVKARYPGLETRANRYMPALRGVLKAFVFVGVAIAILEVWGFGTLTWLGTDAGSAVLNTIGIILLVIVLALALSEFFGLLVERYLRRLDERHVSATRARTLLPLLRTTFRIVLGVLVTLVVLSQIGVDIAPLLAGAGVVGLAIGFGAQKLVQDVINGFFILVDDSIAVGDVVEAGGHSGVVERMTIRTIEMRDLDGTVHTVPFSSVGTIKNFSKDFAFAVVEIPVAYRENVDRVVELLESVGEEMRRDSPVRTVITSPLEVLGVERISETTITVRARFRTLPLQQWTVRREFLRRIKQAFDREGIGVPLPMHRVQVVTPPAPDAPPPEMGGGSGKSPSDGG